jgi:hypothetical protein
MFCPIEVFSDFKKVGEGERDEGAINVSFLFTITCSTAEDKISSDVWSSVFEWDDVVEFLPDRILTVNADAPISLPDVAESGL